MPRNRAWWICATLAGTLLAGGCQSVGAGAYVGRNEFDKLTNRVSSLEASVSTIQASLNPASPAALASGAATWNTSQADSNGPFNVLFSEGTSSTAGFNPPAGTVGPVSGSEKTVYQRGQSLLKRKKFDEAAQVFRQMLDQNPTGKLAPNARYWLGECYYATARYSEAAAHFQRCADDYPNSPKAPDALMKLSYSYDRLGDGPRAMAVMDILLTTYPQSEAAAKIKSGQGKFSG